METRERNRERNGAVQVGGIRYHCAGNGPGHPSGAIAGKVG